jgi:hypothetical protein
MDQCMDQNMVELLRQVREDGRTTALALSRKVQCSRHEANQVLYRLLKIGEVDKDAAFPPMWSVPRPVETAAAAAKTPLEGELRRLVVVDLGNTHDCLKELLPYARVGQIEVRAFADLAYNGFGVNPPLTDAPGVFVQRATTAEKNAADVDMIWDLAELLGHGGSQRYFIAVATKDQGFRRLKALAEARGHQLEFATGWAELRHYVE